MRRLSHRSHVNTNNAGHYNRVDREIDISEGRKPNISGLIRRWSPSMPESMPISQARPLRDRTSGERSPSSGIKLRVYSEGMGKKMLGMALSATSLLTLIEAGYLEADRVEIRGTIDGRPVNATIDEYQYDSFKAKIAV